jgi:hypothetical protein
MRRSTRVSKAPNKKETPSALFARVGKQIHELVKSCEQLAEAFLE